MAFPFLAAAAGAQVVGGALGAVGQLKQGNEALRNAKTQAALMGRDLEISRINTKQRIRDINRQFTALAGQQVARAGKSGVTLSGSSRLVLTEGKREEQLQILRTLFALDVEEAFTPFKQSEAIRSGRIAQSESRLAALGSLFGAAGGAFGALGQSRGAFQPQFNQPAGPVQAS